MGDINLKKKDLLWGFILILIISFLAYPVTRELFLTLTKSHPYILGFIKVSILATMGEFLSIRICTGDFKKPKGLLYKFLVWGFIGMIFVIMFDIFSGGVSYVTNKGLLPAFQNPVLNKLSSAFLTSSIMNLTFAPAFMGFHRVTDTLIDLGDGTLSNILKLSLNETLEAIDWNSFIGFIVLKTIPFFWIPAHTITFMLPSEYRVLAASFLSIALGAILSFSKRQK